MPPELAAYSQPDPEVVAWEKFAAEKKLDMEKHPLHYLFLNKLTYMARQSWKAAIAHMREIKRLAEVEVELKDLVARLPVVAKVLHRPEMRLRDTVQWTHKGEEMTDGESLVRLSEVETLVRELLEENNQLKKKVFKLESHSLNLMLGSVPKPALEDKKSFMTPPWPQDSPFGIPAIVEEKVTLQEVVDLIAKHTNKEYMPYSKSEKRFNSKPEYIKHANTQHPEFPSYYSTQGNEYFIYYLKWDSGLAEGPYHEGRWHHPKSVDHVFGALRFKQVEVVVNLQTLATIVRRCDKDKADWYPWSPELHLSIAIEREAFADHDSYNF